MEKTKKLNNDEINGLFTLIIISLLTIINEVHNTSEDFGKD
jgi:hypothetical protein